MGDCPWTPLGALMVGSVEGALCLRIPSWNEGIGHTLDCGVLPLECMCGLMVFFGVTPRRGTAPEASLESSCSSEEGSLPRQHRKSTPTDQLDQLPW